MLRITLTIASLAGLVLGIVALISPIPVGILIIGISLSTLICVNEKARQLLKKVRHKSHRVNQRIHLLEEKLEKRFKPLSHAFRQTRPALEEPESGRQDKD